MDANGDCFPIAVRTLEQLGSEGFVVHGIVSGQDSLEGVQFVHAWCEAGDVAFDFSNGNLFCGRREHYYQLGNVKEIIRYNPEQVRANLLEHGHYGPWDQGFLEFGEEGRKIA